MNAIQTAVSVDAINALDLGPIKTKLMHRASGEGWSAAYANAVEIEYRRFLTLMKLYPNEATAPLVDVDTFWHYHILDTAKYAADCASAFGYFLHHYPYLGMDGAEDEANRDTAGARMHELYAATFGVTMAAALADTAWCGRVEQPAQQATAWCGRSDQPAQPATAATAWCGATTAQPATATAWCGAATAQNATATAWCGATTAQPATATAWCGATTAQPATATAWCGAATAQNAKPALAWCGMATTAPVRAALAWCGAATAAPAQAGSAWCGAARPAGLQANDTITPAARLAA
jgi:hypothetical protein